MCTIAQSPVNLTRIHVSILLFHSKIRAKPSPLPLWDPFQLCHCCAWRQQICQSCSQIFICWLFVLFYSSVAIPTLPWGSVGIIIRLKLWINSRHCDESINNCETNGVRNCGPSGRRKIVSVKTFKKGISVVSTPKRLRNLVEVTQQNGPSRVPMLLLRRFLA